MEATDGNTLACLFAAGTYLGGDDSVLQMISSTVPVGYYGPQMVCLPSQMGAFGKSQTVGLPYYIPCESCDPAHLLRYEEICFQELHVRLLLKRMTGAPYKAILIELCLAGLGAILSHNALERLALLAKIHNISIIVDEIMTAGRT